MVFAKFSQLIKILPDGKDNENRPHPGRPCGWKENSSPRLHTLQVSQDVILKNAASPAGAPS